MSVFTLVLQLRGTSFIHMHPYVSLIEQINDLGRRYLREAAPSSEGAELQFLQETHPPSLKQIGRASGRERV